LLSLRVPRSPLGLRDIRILALVCSLWVAAFVCISTARADATTPPKKHTASHGKRRSRKSRVKGQQKIDPQRAHDIQEALIRNHYMTGKPTGTWDATSQKAMEKFQADNGWQSKVIPDSRALIKLGLGPDHQHLLNPESAMTAPDKIKPAEHATQSDPATAPAATTAPAPSGSSSQN